MPLSTSASPICSPTASARPTTSPQASGADPSALYRLLRALASLGVLHEADGQRFSLTPLGTPLRSDVPGSIHGWVRLTGRDYLWRSWGNLANAVRTGENSFRVAARQRTSSSGAPTTRRRARSSTRPWGRSPPRRTQRSSRRTTSAASRRWSTSPEGTGRCSPRSSTAHPAARGILFDQEHVVSGAEPVLSVGGRCSTAARSSPAASSSRYRRAATRTS